MADEIIKVLDDLSQRFGIAVDWSNQNMLPYLQTLGNKLVHYEIGMALMYITIGILLLCASRFTYKKWKEYANKDGCLDEVEICAVATVVLVIAGACFIGFNVQTIITGITFPEKLIVEKGLEMLKQYRR